MSLFVIGDLHLHFGSQVKSEAQQHDPLWRDHEKRLMRNCASMINDSDMLVLAGDHSWGRKLEDCGPDLQYIMSLPGKKILLRGNHDSFWDAKKTEMLNRTFEGRLFFLQNNYAVYEDIALVGTKGYTFEGPFYLGRNRRIIGWDENEARHAEQLVERELNRLQCSFEAAKADGFSRYIMFLHYPPTNILETESGFTRMAEHYGAEQVVYAHCHGIERFHDSIQGMYHHIQYRLASGDFLRWVPLKLL